MINFFIPLITIDTFSVSLDSRWSISWIAGNMVKELAIGNLLTMPTHGVREGCLKEIVVFDQKSLHNVRKI